MRHNRTRLSLIEYGNPVDLSHSISSAVGIDRIKTKSLLIEAGSRVAVSLGLNYNPIIVDAKGVRAIGFAGLIKLSPSLELEVSPKFLGLDETDASWREDFFYLSTLSRHGRLLSSERLSASGAAPRDLSTLVARSIISMYEAQKRRPLRSYRRVRESDFYIDGDIDPSDLLLPSSDGYEQEIVRFDRKNSWNADVIAAAKVLLPEVSNPSVASSLVRLIEDLAPQSVPTNRRKPLPSRQKAWKPLHDLSIDVLGGLGLNYKQGEGSAPGYLVDTWRVWEDLVALAVRLGFGQHAAALQCGFPLGIKTKVSTGFTTKLNVYPDCVIKSEGTRPRMILDAKYKGHVEKGQIRISESDLYESLAFSKATDCNYLVLAYPALPRQDSWPVGKCTYFERIMVDNVQIVGIQVECRGIYKKGALKMFSTNLVDGLSKAFS